VRVNRDWAGARVCGGGREGQESDLGGFDRVVGGELEAEAVGLIRVEGIIVKDLDVHEPFGEVVGFHELDAGRQVLFGL